MTIASTQPEDRAVGGDWFESTVQDSRGRSVRSPRTQFHCEEANQPFQSVPPVWKAVKLLWSWIDDNMAGLNSMVNWQEDEPVHRRIPWWEDMTTYLKDEVGWMSLT